MQVVQWCDVDDIEMRTCRDAHVIENVLTRKMAGDGDSDDSKTLGLQAARESKGRVAGPISPFTLGSFFIVTARVEFWRSPGID